MSDYEKVIKKLEIAWNNFDYADQDHIDYAIFNLNICQMEFDNLYKNNKRDD